MKPFKFYENRVKRSYTGGRGIDLMRGEKKPVDNNYPEEWIASCVTANAGSNENCNRGISIVDIDGGIPFDQFLGNNAEQLLGKKHIDRYGHNTACLMKLLDSSIRLPLQAHPNTRKSRDLFNSVYGNNEAWYIVGTRRICGEEPYILLGFNDLLDIEIFTQESISGVLKKSLHMLHKIPIKVCDVYMIPGGLPHVLGPGLTVVEVMEPSDYNVISEKYCGNLMIPDERRFNGLSPEKAMQMYDFTVFSALETEHQFKLNSQIKDKFLTGLISRKRLNILV